MLVFDQNLLNENEQELVCRLSEDSVLLSRVRDFTFLNDTSFIVIDEGGAYLYHISGNFKTQFGNSGQTRGEMISPSCVFATSDYVYIWCRSSMKILIFDHNGNFKNELTNFKNAVSKFVVDSTDENLYLYTSGIFDNSKNKMIDVIEAYNIAERSTKKYGEGNSEDEVLITLNNSGGVYADTDQLVFLNPGNLIIHHLDLISGKTVRYKIEDETFRREEVTHPYKIINDKRKLIDYILTNSVVKGLYKNNDQWIVVTEIGHFDFDMQKQVIESRKNRKIKLYVLDASFTPVHTILYEQKDSPNLVIYSGAMYYLDYNLDNDDQIITLNHFSLLPNSTAETETGLEGL